MAMHHSNNRQPPRGEISTALMVLKSINVELSHPSLIEHGLNKLDQHRMSIAMTLAVLHHEGIRSGDVYFPAKMGCIPTTIEHLGEIKQLVNKGISLLERAREVLI